MGAMNLMEIVGKVISGQMGIDDVCKTVGLTRVTLEGDKVPSGLSKLVDDVQAGGVEVHEVTGKINGVPMRGILVARGKIVLR